MTGTLKLAIHDSKAVDFNNIVTEYQETYLQKLLGEYLYQLFIAAIDGGSPEQKWVDLRDGADFTVSYNGSDLILKWLGLKNMLKYFMFFEYKKQNVSTDTITGESKKQNLNSVFALESRKMNDSFNKGLKLYGLDYNYIAINKSQSYTPNYYNKYKNSNSIYPCRNSGGKMTNMLLESSKIYPSAYNFITTKNKDVADTYPDWYFTKLQHSNSFNL